MRLILLYTLAALPAQHTDVASCLFELCSCVAPPSLFAPCPCPPIALVCVLPVPYLLAAVIPMQVQDRDILLPAYSAVTLYFTPPHFPWHCHAHAWQRAWLPLNIWVQVLGWWRADLFWRFVGSVASTTAARYSVLPVCLPGGHAPLLRG